MTDPAAPPAYDLFVSYARKDNSDGFVDALVGRIEHEFQEIAKRPLRVFLDRKDINAMADWGDVIQKALDDAPVMLAVLSPNYLESWYCRKEWRHYLEREIQRAAFGRSVQPIYYAAVPEQCPGPDARVKQRVRDDLLRRQLSAPEEFARPWAEGGNEALQAEDVRRRLKAVAGAIHEQCRDAELTGRSPTNMGKPNPDFVGRVEDLRKLRAVLMESHAGAIVGVNGLGGIGKTELAFTYAFAYAADYPGGRFSVACENQHDLFPALMSVAHHFGIDQATLEQLYANPDTRAAAEAKLRRALEVHLRIHGSTLIVLDNVTTPAGDGPEAETLAPLLRRARVDVLIPDAVRTDGGRTVSCHLLATTRLPKQSIGDAGRFCIELDALDPDDALRLLERHFGFSDETEERAAIQITNRLGQHALALELIARHLATFADLPEPPTYAKTLASIDADVLEATDAPASDGFVSPFRDPDRLGTSMRSLLAPTLSQLTESERRVLDIAALFPPEQVHTGWVRELFETPGVASAEAGPRTPVTDAHWNRLLRRLLGLRLLTPLHERRPVVPAGAMPVESSVPVHAGAFAVTRMHRLVQAVVSDGMPPGISAAIDGAMMQMAELHAKRLQHGIVHAEDVAHLGTVVSIAFDRSERDDRLSAVLAVASVAPLRRRGRPLDAGTLARSAERRLAIRAAVSPDDVQAQWDLSVSLDRIGDLARASGRVEEARSFYQRGLDIAEQLAAALPDDVRAQRDLSVSVNHIGDLARASGRIDEAQSFYQRGMDIAERLAAALPDDVRAQRDLSISLERMGDLAGSAGRVEEARSICQRGLDIRQQLAAALPDDVQVQRDLSISLNQMGDLARASGWVEEARSFFQRGLDIRERLAVALPDDVQAQRDLSVSLNQMGDLARAAGRVEDARSLYQRGLDIRERLAAALPDDVQTQRGLAISLKKMGTMCLDHGPAERGASMIQRAFGVFFGLARQLSDTVEAQNDLVGLAMAMYRLAIQARNNQLAGQCLMIAHAGLRRMRDREMPMRDGFAPLLAQLDQLAAGGAAADGSASEGSRDEA